MKRKYKWASLLFGLSTLSLAGGREAWMQAERSGAPETVEVDSNASATYKQISWGLYALGGSSFATALLAARREDRSAAPTR